MSSKSQIPDENKASLGPVNPDKKELTLRQILASDKFRNQLADSLPRYCTPERFARIAMSALNRVPKLMECTQQSVLKCLMDLSAFGLEPDGRNAHLIPYGKDCTLIIDWKGLVALAKRNGDVKAWQAFDVCERDEFSWENGIVRHRINYREDRGEPECYYSMVTLADGSVSYEVMTKAEVDKVRKISKAANNGPWVSFYGEMAKKTVIRRHSKQLDLSPQVQEAIAAGDELERTEHNVTPIKSPSLLQASAVTAPAELPPVPGISEGAEEATWDGDDGRHDSNPNPEMFGDK